MLLDVHKSEIICAKNQCILHFFKFFFSPECLNQCRVASTEMPLIVFWSALGCSALGHKKRILFYNLEKQLQSFKIWKFESLQPVNYCTFCGTRKNE